jgi:small subunit ribosomal protein S6
MRKYEIMLILPAEADDKVIGGVTDRITGVLSTSGGEITKTDRWGKRRFAYPIAKATEGFYLVSEFSAEPEILKELDRVLSLADDVIRFKVVVRPDKERPSTRAPKTEDAGASTEAPASSVAEADPEAEASQEPAAEAAEEAPADEASADSGAA